LSKTTSFQLNHIPHKMAHIPTKINFLIFPFIFRIQVPNMWFMLEGDCRPKLMYSTLQVNFARSQSMKRCCIVSLLWQKQHVAAPCQFLLSKLSLVNITFLYNSHRNTLTFSGILSFHRNILCGTISESIIVIYIELTENCPLDVSAHLKMSGWSFKCIFAMLWTRSCHDYRFTPTKLLRNETFSGVVLKTRCTVALFFPLLGYTDSDITLERNLPLSIYLPRI
jgi:hypothetical protein